MSDKLINLGINILVVLCIILFGEWITNGNHENMVIYLLSALMVNQYMILDRFDEWE